MKFLDDTEVGSSTFDQPPPLAPEAFEVRDAASANWLVRKIIEARAYRQRVKVWAEAETRRSEREEGFFLERYGPQLERWARQQIADGRRKSVALPSGVIGYRTEPTRLDITDEKKLIVWCKQLLPSALNIQTTLNKSAIRQHISGTGECPDGAELGGGGQQFYVSESRKQ